MKILDIKKLKTIYMEVSEIVLYYIIMVRVIDCVTVYHSYFIVLFVNW
jgi:hypothetical protein